LRVAIIVPRLEECGPVKVIQSLVNSLYKIDGIQIMVFYLDKYVDNQIKMMVPIERLDKKRFCFGDYDIIHTNGIRPDLFAFINRQKIKYHISTIHNFVFEDLTFTYNKLISLIFGNLWLVLWGRADNLVCVSKAMKEYYSQWFPSTKLEVIYNGIAEVDNSLTLDIEIIEAINEIHSKKLKIIGASGILTKRKGIDQILHLLAERKEFALVIIGKGKELANLQHLAEKLKISERCLFCGFRSYAVNYFRYFDFFIVPSISEGFGLVLIEAVQQKIPVICSDIKVFQELFNSYEVTFFNLKDCNSLDNALKLATKTGNNKVEFAYTRFMNNYIDQFMARKYYELYKSV